MASVHLRFTPPAEPGFTTLHIYESASKTGAFLEIDQTPAGSYPDYITSYTTTAATAEDYWFSIQWTDALGAESEMSIPVQGGTETLVGIIVQRMLLRDPSINPIIAAQEAEAAICVYYGVSDPSTIDPATVPPQVLSGLTLLAMGWAYIVTTSISSSAQKFTAGLVSLDLGGSSTSTKVNTDALIKQAEKLLGRGFSRILQMKELEVSSGYTQLVAVDLTRTIFELQ